MEDGIISLTDSELRLLSTCISNARLGNSLLYASCGLFLFDYALTVYHEGRFIWWPRRFSLGAVSFAIARYTAMASTIISLLRSSSVIVDSLNTVLRLTAIVSSEFIVAVRTWAIWEKNRKILYTLAVFSFAAVIPASIIVARSVITNHVEPLISPALVDLCSVMISKVRNGFVVPYVLTIIYEIVTLSLSLFRITTWRKTIPQAVRVPLLDTLWRDGVLYFSFMLVLGFMNIGLILQSEAPQLRQGGAHLQAVLHSIMSTRIVLHLADSKTPRDITTAGCSIHRIDTGVIFTTRISTANDGAERLPMSRARPEDELEEIG